MKRSKGSSRRDVLKIGAAAVGGGLLVPEKVLGLETPGKLGIPLGPYGERSPYEKSVRWRRESKTPETGSSFSSIRPTARLLVSSNGDGHERRQ